MELPDVRPQEPTPLVEALLAILRHGLERLQHREGTGPPLRDDNALRKGHKPRPPIKPSQPETPTAPPRPKDGQRPGSDKRVQNSQRITTDVPLHLDTLPPGAVLKGQEPSEVQELGIAAQATRQLRARSAWPDGGSVRAPGPADVRPGSPSGPHRIGQVLDQHHHAHVTQPVLLQQRRDFAIDRSAGQLQRLGTENPEVFHQQKDEVRAAGLATASSLGAEDTDARHQGRNGQGTVIGHDVFACLVRSDCPSRRNFLEALHGDQRLYAIHERTLAYGQQHGWRVAVGEPFRQDPHAFACASAWQARWVEWALTADRHVRRASEGALRGGLSERGVSPAFGVLSDGAPPLDLWLPASGGMHAERPLARLVPPNDAHRHVIEPMREPIGPRYQDLKAYRQQPEAWLVPDLAARFTALCHQRTGYATIDAVLKEMRDHPTDLWRVWERPAVALPNKASASAIRADVTKRTVSGGSRRTAGRRCRDTFVRLKKTCRQWGLTFWTSLQDRVRGLGQGTRLAERSRQGVAGRPAAAVEAVLVGKQTNRRREGPVKTPLAGPSVHPR